MEQKGKIFAICTPETGTSKSGNAWSRQTVVISFMDGSYEKKLAFSVIKNEVLQKVEKLKVGDDVNVKFNISSREYNGRWFTDIVAWSIWSENTPTPAPTPPSQPDDIVF